MCYSQNPVKQLYHMLWKYSDRDQEDLIPDRENGHEIAKLLCDPEGREKYLAWQREHNEMWRVLRTAKHRLTALACDACKGKGEVPLLVNVAPCPDCQEPRAGGPFQVWNEEPERMKSVYEKKRIIGEYVLTPKGRKKLAEALKKIRETGCNPTPLRWLGKG